MALAMPEASAARTPHWASIAANSSRHMSSPGDRVTRWRWLLPTNRLGPADYDILGRRPWDGRSSATLHSARPTPASPGPLGKGTGGPQGRRGKAPVELPKNLRSEIFKDRLCDLTPPALRATSPSPTPRRGAMLKPSTLPNTHTSPPAPPP